MSRETANKQVTCLTFRLGDELFGLNTKNVIRIMENRGVRKVSGYPYYIAGEIDWNKRRISVLDTRQRLGLNHEPATLYSSIIIIKINKNKQGENYFGLIVDMVEEIVDLESFKIHAVPPAGIRFKFGIIANIAQWKERYIMMLDTEQLINNNHGNKYKSEINQLSIINN